mmetsp:Transcript_8519/g.24528  ORF Transcript_8519/g.24528 Transcript_8519/m.24528 type:complete len:250 (-) Transcript_8519:94-843(-)
MAPQNDTAPPPPPLSQKPDASARTSSTECPRQKAGRGNNNQDPVLAVSTATEPTVINGKEEGKWEEGNHDHDNGDDDGLESFEAMLRNIRKRQFADIFSAAGCVLDDGSLFALGAASVTIEDAADRWHSARHVDGQELPRQLERSSAAVPPIDFWSILAPHEEDRSGGSISSASRPMPRIRLRRLSHRAFQRGHSSATASGTRGTIPPASSSSSLSVLANDRSERRRDEVVQGLMPLFGMKDIMKQAEE